VPWLAFGQLVFGWWVLLVAVRAWSSVGMIFWISSYFVWVDVADGGGRKIKIGRENENERESET
jgi:hypothetical protein